MMMSSLPNDVRLMHLSANLLVSFTALLLLAGLVVRVIHRPMFQLTQLRIAPIAGNGFQYVSQQAVQATIAGQLSGNFFRINLQKVSDVLETAPWVRRAQVRRLWPDALAVTIEEHIPLAIWNEDQMINQAGEVFSANQGELRDDLILPRLTGPEQSEQLVVQRYAELVHQVEPLNLHIQSIELSPRYAWNVVLSNGVHLHLGRDPAADVADLHGRSGALPFAQRIERFIRAWPSLQQQLAGRAVTQIDLRYSNGFAMTLASPSF